MFDAIYANQPGPRRSGSSASSSRIQHAAFPPAPRLAGIALFSRPGAWYDPCRRRHHRPGANAYLLTVAAGFDYRRPQLTDHAKPGGTRDHHSARPTRRSSSPCSSAWHEHCISGFLARRARPPRNSPPALRRQAPAERRSPECAVRADGDRYIRAIARATRCEQAWLAWTIPQALTHILFRPLGIKLHRPGWADGRQRKIALRSASTTTSKPPVSGPT